MSISCTPRGQICKSCTPDAAGLISCARQNWSVHANHAGKFSVHAEDLPENVHTFQTDRKSLAPTIEKKVSDLTGVEGLV